MARERLRLQLSFRTMAVEGETAHRAAGAPPKQPIRSVFFPGAEAGEEHEASDDVSEGEIGKVEGVDVGALRAPSTHDGRPAHPELHPLILAGSEGPAISKPAPPPVC